MVAAGAVYTTASFTGAFDADLGAGVFNLTTAGQLAVLVTKLDATGNFVGAGAITGSGYHQGLGIAVDGGGNVYVTGSFRGTADFDPGKGTALVDSTLGVAGEPGADRFLVQLVPSV